MPEKSAMSPQETGMAYDEIAEWLGKAMPPEYGRAYLDEFIGILPRGGKVLDLGCGFGRWSGVLLDRGFAVTGVDVSAELLAMARRRYPRGEWVLADGAAYFPAEKFDGILCWDSLFHLPHAGLAPLLRNFGAMLKPGGALLYTGGDTDGSIEGSMQGVRFTYAALDERETRRILTDGGFEILHCDHDQPGEHHLVVLAQKKEGKP